MTSRANDDSKGRSSLHILLALGLLILVVGGGTLLWFGIIPSSVEPSQATPTTALTPAPTSPSEQVTAPETRESTETPFSESIEPSALLPELDAFPVGYEILGTQVQRNQSPVVTARRFIYTAEGGENVPDEVAVVIQQFGSRRAAKEATADRVKTTAQEYNTEGENVTLVNATSVIRFNTITSSGTYFTIHIMQFDEYTVLILAEDQDDYNSQLIYDLTRHVFERYQDRR